MFNSCRPWYVATKAPAAKDVVIAIDRSASMSITDSLASSGSRLFYAKDAANAIIDSLSPTDRVIKIFHLAGNENEWHCTHMTIF